jgi:hypothetical protein
LRNEKGVEGLSLARRRIRELHRFAAARMLASMIFARRALWSDLGKAFVLWLGVGLSLGWYYAFTYYGRSGWPMPAPEPCAALILYYYSVLNVSTVIQAVHWLVVFPVAGLLWVSTLTITAPYFGGKRTEYAWTVLRFSVTSVPLILPAPVMAYLAGRTVYGFSWQHMLDVALRRAGATPGSWVTPLYVGLAIAALIWQIFVHAKIFDLYGKKAMQHYVVSAIFLVIFSCGAATLASWPLRWALE